MKSTATKAATGKKGKATIAAQATANPVLATEKIAQTDNEKKHGKKILSDNLFPVVGIGASAGGLDAFKRLLKAIPEKSGMAYIIVQHLDPNHKSILTELLQKITPIPVEEITDNVEVRPDHIYIIPSNKLLTATDGVLQLSDRLPRNYKTMSIDLFFCSLAEVHQSHAIGVVLSGTGKDGTAGLRAIKDQGGITFAQELQSSSHDAMPQSAIDADVVDFILPPEGIPEKLLSVSKAFKPVSGLPEDAAEVALEIGFKQILFLLRIRKGVDFSYYKQTTIRRRITRRIALSLKGSMPEYLAFLKTNGEEQDMLFQDLLIPVTQFFRDPKVFAQLCDTVFPSLLKNREGSDPLRFWIAGCSTGQEVYSMVMCMHEYLDDKAMISRIQIFGTDISEPAITKARNGIYTKTEVEGVSAVRLKKFFTRTDGRYRINKNIRESCMFANHNYLKDPPFAQIDLISCRNSLIYLEQVVQKNALTTFHYALKEGGFLLLGKSETTAQVPDLYMVFDKGSKIYTRKPGRGKFSHALTDRPEEAFINTGNVLSKGEGNKDDFQKAADDIILSKALAGVVVNKDLDIVQFRGATGLWLEPSPGKPNMNVIKMAREGLAFELRSALHKVKESQEAFIKEEIPIQFLGRENLVTIEVSPLTGLA
ncbi:MAG: histidine kinase, partial [Flavisolibacter sp.]|nr:histidine kinase [Flavisolibacter sp.]